MNAIRGYYRLCLASLALGLGGTLITLTSWIPWEIRGFRPSFWILVLTVRTVLLVLNVKVDCPAQDQFRAHHGFIFPNHVSYADPLVMAAITPVRFLAKEEIRSWPVIGLIARGIGCVFVKRESRESRAQARAALAQVETFPPITLFPEGKRGPGDRLLPFRYGAFEIVLGGSSSYLPCAIIYDPLDIIIWHRGEHILKAAWRLATFPGPVTAKVVASAAVHTQQGDDPVKLSLEAHRTISELIPEKASPQEPQT